MAKSWRIIDPELYTELMALYTETVMKKLDDDKKCSIAGVEAEIVAKATPVDIPVENSLEVVVQEKEKPQVVNNDTSLEDDIIEFPLATEPHMNDDWKSLRDIQVAASSAGRRPKGKSSSSLKGLKKKNTINKVDDYEIPCCFKFL